MSEAATTVRPRRERKPRVAAPPPAPRFVPLKHMPQVFGISRTQCYKLEKAGAIVMRRAGRAVLVEVASVDRYLAGGGEAK